MSLFNYSDSTYNPKIYEQGGVRILDPNPNQEVVPPEDLFIYISLVAKQRSKSVLTETSNNSISIDSKKMGSIDLAVPQEISSSQLFKSKPMLTTDWTEIGGYRSGVELYKDYEGFGITNIDVSIKSQTSPQVVIDFVDVRGATLFEQGSCSPYGLFFNLPYPIFVLTLKGYYGKPIEYQLNLVKFNSKFNSDTGNMECRAEFIGYSFAFLSDMVMGYVAASQYLSETEYRPQEILKRKYQETVANDGNNINNFCNNSARPNRCLSIQDLLSLVNNFDTTVQPEIINSPEFNELQNLTQLKNSYLTYIEDLNKLVQDLAKAVGDSNSKSSNEEGMENRGPLRFEITTDDTWNQLINKDNGILKSYFNNTSGTLKTDIMLTKTKEIKPGIKADSIIDMATTAKADEFAGENNQCPGCNKLYNKFKDKPWNNIFYSTNADTNRKALEAGINFEQNNFDSNNGIKFIDIGYLIKDAESELTKLIGEGTGDNEVIGIITDKKKKAIENINKIVKKSLGFDPTIRNIFTILLCNTDAFMEIVVNVATEAEKYHNQRTNDYKKLTERAGDGPTGLISGTEGEGKVFAWPTYYKKVFNGTIKTKEQGTKESYPGNDTRFVTWVEVRFVEDFLNALIEWNKDRKIQNGELEGMAGFDNYVPINPLEAPALNKRTAIKYLDITQKDQVYKIIGERLFIALDHTYFSPIRLTDDSVLIPNIGIQPNWSPIDNKSDNVSKDIGTIEANNILYVHDNESGRKTLASLMVESSETEFIQEIYKVLKLETKKASELSRLSSISNESGFSSDDEYYIYNPIDTDEKGGYIQLNNSGNSAKIRPNPFNMLTDELIVIKDEEGDFEIKLVPEDGPMKRALSTYTENLSSQISNITFSTEDFKIDAAKITGFIVDKKEKIISWEDSRLYTTLAMVSESNEDGTPWFTSGQISQLSQSNMGLISYPDYAGGDGTYGISLFGPEGEGEGYKSLFTEYRDGIVLGSKGVEYEPWEGIKRADPYLINGNLDDKGGGGYNDDDGASTAFVTTPLWLDNVRKFRGIDFDLPNDFYIGNDVKIYDKGTGPSSLEYRNLAYLFLQTLKMTPPVIRYVDDNWEFFYDKDQNSFIHSLKAFNVSAGVAKVPKAWALTLGAILWRWKMFVGTKEVDDNRVWNKPLSCVSCDNGESPTGFDPLAQPGFPTTDNVDRCNPVDYLTKIYGSSVTIQKSSFSTITDKVKGTLGTTLGQKLEGGIRNFSCYAWFPYFNYLEQKKLIGNLGLKNKNGQPILVNTGWDSLKSAGKYSWPMLWIAPHHIPYVSPERYFDNETDGTAFVQLFNNNVGYIDYITMMNTTVQKQNYYESNQYNLGETERSKVVDGNLGMVLQYLPDKVKDAFVKYFDDWCQNEWESMLATIDPVNFGSPSARLSDTYDWNADISYEILGNSDNSTTLTLKENDSTAQLKKLLNSQAFIYNTTPKMWYGITDEKEGPTSDKSDFYNSFLVSKVNFESYLKNLYQEYRKNVNARLEEINKKTTQEENELSGSLIEDDDIKLSIYRTFKSLTDKWVSSLPNGTSFFNVTQSGKSSDKCGESFNKGPRTLASHFQYVNRVMGDIGNIAMINISKIRELNNNPKISLYQYVSDILTDNEYMFFPLPGYIDFTSQGVKKEDLQQMFKPVLSLKNLSCGPVFLCMYVGGTSRQLKYKANANCPADLKELKQLEDDGFLTSDLKSNGGAGLPSEIADPWITDKNAGYTSFKIVYGLENQNHFKNIQLDQAEFSETAESLLVIDKISKQGGTDQTTKGQNLNTMYLTRSYSCQVESLGNMMIQPMTYFDLIGVPMFNGAYLITEVSHNFKPNHATTRFKGVRQPRATVPVVTDAAVAMNMSFKDMVSKGDGKSLEEQAAGVSSSSSSASSGAVAAKFLPEISNEIMKLFSNPMQCTYKPNVSSNFLRSSGQFHGGLDIVPTTGMELYTDGQYKGKAKSVPVVSTYNGIVVRAGESSGFGTPPNGGVVVVRYGEDNGNKPFSDGFYYMFVYGHVNPAPNIKVNSVVKTGDILGNAVFPAAESTGLHLHLQIHRQPSDKVTWVPGQEYMIVPSPFLNQKENCITGIIDYTSGQIGDSFNSGPNVPTSNPNAPWRTDKEFLTKVKNLAKKYNFKPEEFVAVLNSESGLNTKAIFPGNLKLNIETCKEYCRKKGRRTDTCCSATGINQMLPDTLEKWGVTTDQYYNYSRAQQMDYVEKMFDELYQQGYFKGQVTGGVLYGLNFLPARVKACAGKGSDCVLTYKGEKSSNGKLLSYYESNEGLDTNKNNEITISDLDARVANIAKSLGNIDFG
jgi:murein DD-endopeptidase MepM/ murein hydrolase activator NlpD